MSDASTAFDVRSFRAAYSRFLRDDRVLFTGHSHQAWPDVAREAALEAYDDAAAFVDDKWGKAIFPKLGSVGRAVLRRLGFPESDPITFGKSTHELVTRLLSCFRLADRPTVVTTTGEFHSLHRQLSRLAEEGLRVTWVDATERASLAERLIAAIEPGTSLVAFSAVLFEDGYILPRLGEIVTKAVEAGAVPLVDAYHAFNTVPIAWGPCQEQLFVTAGGYKYAQLGEGVCFLRSPRQTHLRPADTGWFANFEALAHERTTSVEYGAGGDRFSGATFDATSFYRADAVLRHWDKFGLDVAALRAISLRQTRRIIERIEEAGLGERIVSSRDDERRGGFVAFRSEAASAVVDRLRERGVFTDSRGDLLRIGPAPYMTEEEIDRGMAIVTRALLEARSAA